MTKLLSELSKGTWSGATAYTIGDIVDNDGSSYVCIANNTNQEPPNATYWALLAAKGDTGSTGATGATGATGTEYPWEGQWLTATAYSVNDCVHNDGSGYVCIQAHTSGATDDEPGTGATWETYWDLLVQGDPGTTLTLTAAPGTDHSANGVTITLTANENQAFGDVCYINVDGEAQIGDADAIATSVIVAMATATILADAAGEYLILGIARDDTWNWTVGGKIYLTVTGTSGNTLSQTAPSGTDDCIVEVGVAINADRMFFNPTIQAIVEHTG